LVQGVVVLRIAFTRHQWNMARRASESGRSTQRSSSSSTASGADVEAQVRSVENSLNLEISALHGLSKEVSNRLSVLEAEEADVSATLASNQSLGQISHRSRQFACSNLSVHPAEAEAEGRRTAAPVGARRRRAVGPDGGRSKCQETLKDIQSLEARCRMAMQHLNPVSTRFKKLSDSGHLRAGHGSVIGGHVTPGGGKHLQERLKEARALCSESRTLSGRALRYTNAGAEWCWDVAPCTAEPSKAPEPAADERWQEDGLSGEGELQMRLET